MKIITIVAEQISADALSAALPTEGIASVTVTQTRSFSPTARAVESYRGRKIANHFADVYRVEIAADDAVADAVIAGVAFARGAGLLGNARAWVSATVADLFTTASELALSA